MSTHKGHSPDPIALGVRCRKCGRAEECTVSGLFDYLLANWPICCEEPMAMHLELRRPGDRPDSVGPETRSP